MATEVTENTERRRSSRAPFSELHPVEPRTRGELNTPPSSSVTSVTIMSFVASSADTPAQK
jgi:hypothetical protein